MDGVDNMKEEPGAEEVSSVTADAGDNSNGHNNSVIIIKDEVNEQEPVNGNNGVESVESVELLPGQDETATVTEVVVVTVAKEEGVEGDQTIQQQQNVQNDDEVNCEEEEEDDFDSDNFVPESAFWHVEASLDNGFEVGMKVEVEHDAKKYWIATIVGVFGKLLSLKWEGSSEQIFLDVSSKRCYPNGYYRNQPNYFIEPPPKISLSDKTILDVTIKYFQLPSKSNHPDEFYARGGVSTDLFEDNTVLEVAHKLNPEKHWFAQVVRNVGGRLLLRWLLREAPEQEAQQEHKSSNDFWLFFCHSRVHHLGFAKEAGNISYEPPVPYDSWIADIEAHLKVEQSDTAKLRRFFLTSAKEKKPELLDADSSKSVAEGDKVLLFPSNLLKLLPATIESKLSEGSYLISATGPAGDISFCYPYEDNHAILPFSWSDDNEIPIEFDKSFTGSDWSAYLASSSSRTAPIVLKHSDRIGDYKINGKIEVVHPDQPETICEAIVIRVTAPLVWIQLSSESIYVLPFNSTDLLPSGFCKSHSYPLTKLMPSRSALDKIPDSTPPSETTVKIEDATVLPALSEEIEAESIAVPSLMPPANGSKAWCPRIYFNHKCFTGPSLSKSKICELPRFVGPGPVLLVIQEVISKIISVAYVPSRILNELSGKAFDAMLKKNKIRKVEKVVFKAKYQKRTYRDSINVIRTSEQVEEFCRATCSHLKCCYNLFGPNLYDGDTCPSNCRGLTKSNKVLKRATFYRDKAVEEKKPAVVMASKPEPESKAVIVQKENTTNVKEDVEDKESSKKSSESEEEEAAEEPVAKKRRGRIPNAMKQLSVVDRASTRKRQEELGGDQNFQVSVKENKRLRTVAVVPKKEKAVKAVVEKTKVLVDKPVEEAIDPLDNPLNWTVGEVYNFLSKSECSAFARILRDHEIDGSALMLLDYETIRTNIFAGYTRKISLEDIARLSHIIKRVKTRWLRIMRLGNRISSSHR